MPEGASWGWNPATVQALASIALTFGVAVAVRALWFVRDSTNAAKQAAESASVQAQTMQKESELRMRPWLHLKDFKVDSSEKTFQIEYANVGSLPAENTICSFSFAPVAKQATLAVIAQPWEHVVAPSTIFPNEPSGWTLSPRMHAPIGNWFDEKLDVKLSGSFAYQSGTRSYITEFEATVIYGADGEGYSQWGNTRAT